MKNIWIIIFLFISFQTFSQVKKSYFKIGYQRGSTMHLGVRGLGYHAQYEFSLKDDGFSTSIGIGQMYGNEIEVVRSRGSVGIVTWDNIYKIPSSEGSFYAEVSGLVSCTQKLKRIDLQIGGGFTFLSNSLNYYKNINIFRGIIMSYQPTKFRDYKAMLNLVLDNNIILSDRFLIHFKFIFRKRIGDREPLIGIINGSSTSKYKFDSMTSMVIGLGYCF